MTELLNTLKRLTEAFGPSGQEDGIAAVLTELVSPYADELRRDALGNLIVHKRGEGKRLLFSAHMDTVGVMVTEIEENGFCRIAQTGGLVAADISRLPVRFENGTRAVITPPEDKEEKSYKLDDLRLDLGVSKREEAEKLVSLGDNAVYPPVFCTQGNCLFANYLDNRAGCLLLVELLRRAGRNNDLWCVFSAQEEVGMRGARTAAFGIEPDAAIAVDVTCTDDQPGASHTATAMLGKGAALKVMDHSVLCSPAVTAALERTAAEQGIPSQKDIMQFGGTDAGAIQPVRAGIPTGGISIPCRYTHTPVECIDLRDLTAAIDLAAAYTESEIIIDE